MGIFTGCCRMAQMGSIEARFKHFCPFCGAGTPETDVHLVTCCSAWGEERQAYLGKVIDVVISSTGFGGVGGLNEQASALFAVLLGGVWDGRISLRSWAEPLAAGPIPAPARTQRREFCFPEVAAFMAAVLSKREARLRDPVFLQSARRSDRVIISLAPRLLPLRLNAPSGDVAAPFPRAMA